MLKNGVEPDFTVKGATLDDYLSDSGKLVKRMLAL